MRGGGKEKGEVLMGNRRMACQCQKWSCAEERLGENEREDGRRAWLINLFTSMKMLRAPLWLKFSLPSIIAVAGLSLQSCRYQTLSKRSSLQPAPPPATSLLLSVSSIICILYLSLPHLSVNLRLIFSLSLFLPHLLSLYVCLPFYLLLPVCFWASSSEDSPGMVLVCLSPFPPMMCFPNSRLLAPPA